MKGETAPNVDMRIVGSVIGVKLYETLQRDAEIEYTRVHLYRTNNIA